MDTFDFYRLPPELRNAIYTATFSSRYAVKLKTNAIEHPLTATCRRARQEALEMYLSMTRFNAHIDDGPATPVARWLRVMGRHQCLLLRELSIWNLHTLSVTLHGAQATQLMLDEKLADGEAYILRPLCRQLVHCSKLLMDVGFALQSLGLGLARFCITQYGIKRKETSNFAILPMAELDGAHADPADAEALAEHFGLEDRERRSLVDQLRLGYAEVRVCKGRRSIVLEFDELHLLTCLRHEVLYDEVLF